MIEFEATIEPARGGGANVVVPPEVVEALGGWKRTPVRAAFDGIGYVGTVLSMGGPDATPAPGDTLYVTIEVDESDRRVEVPVDLVAALESAGVRGIAAVLGELGGD